MMIIIKNFKKNIYFRSFRVKVKRIFLEITLKTQLENINLLNYILVQIQNRLSLRKVMILSYIVSHDDVENDFLMYAKLSKRLDIKNPKFFDTDFLNVSFESCFRKVDSMISRCVFLQDFIASKDITDKIV